MKESLREILFAQMSYNAIAAMEQHIVFYSCLTEKKKLALPNAWKLCGAS